MAIAANEADVNEQELAKRLAERFVQLPKVVQNAITSAEIEKRLRKLADTHKLHLDQWELLENEVRLTVYGFQQTEDLSKNIENEVGVSKETADALTSDISQNIFEPIREELERELESPDAKEKKVGELDEVRSEMLGDKPAAPIRDTRYEIRDTIVAPPIPDTRYAIPDTIPVLPSTPPPPPSTEKSIRAPLSSSYTSQAPSHERIATEGDPYREPTA